MNARTTTGDLTLTVHSLSARTAVLAARGWLNAATMLAFKTRVDEVVRQGRPEIVCDLAGVTSVDSSGLAGLIFAVKVATSRAGFFKIAAASEEVRRMFRSTRLDGVLEIHDSVESVLGEDAMVQEIRRAA